MNSLFLAFFLLSCALAIPVSSLALRLMLKWLRTESPSGTSALKTCWLAGGISLALGGLIVLVERVTWLPVGLLAYALPCGIYPLTLAQCYDLPLKRAALPGIALTLITYGLVAGLQLTFMMLFPLLQLIGWFLGLNARG